MAARQSTGWGRGRRGDLHIADKIPRREASCVQPMSSFTNPASSERIVFGVISHLDHSWERKPLCESTQNA